MKRYVIYFICIIVSLTLCNTGCKHNHSHSHEGHTHDDNEAEQESPEKQNHSDEIIFTKEQAKIAGLEITEVKSGPFNQVIKTSGQIISAQGDEATVAATTSGIISYGKTAISEGIPVRQGETLLTISAKNMGEGDPLQKARLAFETAQKQYQRAESLIGDKLISQKEFEQIKLDYETAKVAYEAFAKNQTDNGARITAPIGGFIKNRLAAEGEFVSTGQPLLTITRNRRLQLRADVSERYYKDLPAIHSANFKTPYTPDIYKLTELNGKIISFGKSSNPGEHYIPVNFEFDNIGQLIPGSYIEIFLLSKTTEHVITVPVSSLIEEQGIYSVYIQVDDEGYRKQEVRLGNNDGENVQIISGLSEGDKIVSKGAYLVKLAASSGTIPEGHSHSH